MDALEQISLDFYDKCVQIANISHWIVLGVFIIVVLGGGLALLISDDVRKNAKKWIPWVILAVAIALCPVIIAEAIAGAVQF